MKDLVTRETGNSRLLKSSIPAGTTWEEALALLRAGNFPIDLKGLNSAGVSTTGSAYNKANVLPDSLCSSLGITSSTAEPKDAWNAVLQKINTVNTSLSNFISNDFPQPTKQGVARPNILENWYFYGGGSQNGNGRFPINQKGTTSQTGSGYFIDRWRKSNTVGTTSLATAGMTIVGDGSSGNYMGQRLEYPNKLYGKTVTISFLNSSGQLASATGTMPSALPSETTAYATTSRVGNVRFRLMGNSSYIYVELDASAVSSTAIQAVKLELGPNQTLARQVNNTWVLNEIPNFATELTKCQRFMVAFKAAHSGGSYNVTMEDAIGTGSFYESYYFHGFIPLPVTMRTTPSLSGALYIYYDSYDYHYYAVDNSDTTIYLRPNGLSFRAHTSTAGSNINVPCIVASYNAVFDANL